MLSPMKHAKWLRSGIKNDEYRLQQSYFTKLAASGIARQRAIAKSNWTGLYIGLDAARQLPGIPEAVSLLANAKFCKLFSLLAGG